MIKTVTSPDSTLGKPCIGNDNFKYHWQIILAFGLEDYVVANAKKFTLLPKVIKSEDGSNAH